MTTDPGSERDPVEQLAESFQARLRRGERPSLEEYVVRCPERADDIRELFPALVEMEQLKPLVDQPPTPAEPAALHPQRLGDYQILRVIGSGGMGVVYEAEHESLKNRVALKVMHPRFRTDPTYLRRFHTEARSAARLHHTNIVPVFDYGEQDGICYYAMSLIAGVGLHQVLEDVRRLRVTDDSKSNPEATGQGHQSATKPVAPALRAVTQGLLTGRFATGPATPSGTEPPSPMAVDDAPRDATGGNGPEADIMVSAPSGSDSQSESHTMASQSESIYTKEIVRLAGQVADALDYAHRQKVVHRDIKPSNLLLDAQGNVWVTDFGLAKFVEGDDVSQSHDLVGTLRFMGPERFRGVTDRRADIYALGATLYEMLALRPAFAERDQIRLIEQITHQPPPPLRQHDRRIPRDLETVVLKAMAKDPTDRFATAGEMRDELQRFLEEQADQVAAGRARGTVLAVVQAQPRPRRGQHHGRHPDDIPGHWRDDRGVDVPRTGPQAGHRTGQDPGEPESGPGGRTDGHRTARRSPEGRATRPPGAGQIAPGRGLGSPAHWAHRPAVHQPRSAHPGGSRAPRAPRGPRPSSRAARPGHHHLGLDRPARPLATRHRGGDVRRVGSQARTLRHR